MEFQVECDGNSGMLIIDKAYLKELTMELLISMDYLLDYHGDTELKYDYPLEEWVVVRERESNIIRNFCNSGKMVILLLKGGDYKYTLELNKDESEKTSYLNVKSGKLLVINADEVIQCLPYPEMEMEIIVEFEVKQGWCGVSFDEIGKINISYNSIPKIGFSNIKENY